MRYILILLLLCSCTINAKHELLPDKFQTVCHDGIEYLILIKQQPHSKDIYFSIKLDRNSKVIECAGR